MLLKSIQARNFMKYKCLEVKDLPTKGIIGIFGENESGKSTIGEAVSFALFGATTRFKEEALAQWINWDADECEVEIVFVLEDGQYRLVRSFDRKGTQQAALYKGEKEVLAKKGAANVTKEIERLTRFNFQNFRSTFYLAQKEIDILKQIRENAQSIVHKMLGFDLLPQGCEFVDKELKQLASRREKCENEMLLTKSLVSNIKIEGALEKELSVKGQEFKGQKKQLEEKGQQLEMQSSKSQEILETHQKLCDAFNALERSFYYSFHKDKLGLSLKSLSQTYALVKEERTRLTKNKAKSQKEEETLQQKLQELASLDKQFLELKNLLQVHSQNLQKKLTFTDKNSHANHDNLQYLLHKKEREINYTALEGLVLIGLGGITLLFMLWGLVTFSISTLLSSAFITGMSLWGTLLLRKKLQQARQRYESLLADREKTQKELEICLHLSWQNLGELEKHLMSLDTPKIHERFADIKKQFTEIFTANVYLDPLLTQLAQQRESCVKLQKGTDDKLLRLENMIKIMETLSKEIDFLSASREEDIKLLDDLSQLEKNIYGYIEAIQEHHASLHEFDDKTPVEIEIAWQEYEQCRNKFRNLTALSSIGGGTGMLNRLQTVFRQKNVEKLAIAMASERESLFSLLPTKETLAASCLKDREARQKCQDDLALCLQRLKDNDSEHQKVSDELDRKKDLVIKIQALGRQLQELDRNIAVNKTMAELMQNTLTSVGARFAPSVSRVMSKVLPRVTNGRYQHVQVSDDMTLKVFSTDKNDFVNLTELSGGTIDQLFISLRLALSQAVMAAKTGNDNKQFLFFDEPLISFDEERSASFLNLLTDYNKNFVQVFLVSPRSYPQELFDLVINTSLDKTEMNAASKAGGQARIEIVQPPQDKPGTEKSAVAEELGKTLLEAVKAGEMAKTVKRPIPTTARLESPPKAMRNKVQEEELVPTLEKTIDKLEKSVTEKEKPVKDEAKEIKDDIRVEYDPDA